MSDNWERDSIEKDYDRDLYTGIQTLKIEREYIDDLGIKRNISDEKYQEILKDRISNNERVKKDALTNRRKRIVSYEDRLENEDRILGKRSDWEENRYDDNVTIGTQKRPVCSYLSENFKSNLVMVLIFLPISIIIIFSFLIK